MKSFNNYIAEQEDSEKKGKKVSVGKSTVTINPNKEDLKEETPAERIDRISKENVAKRAAASKVDKEKRDANTAAFQSHKKDVLTKGGRPVDALDSWQKKKMTKEELDFASVLDELTDEDLLFLSDDLIEEVVEEFFYETLEEGFEIEELETLLIEHVDSELTYLEEATVTVGHDSDVKPAASRTDKLAKIKSAVHKVASGAKKVAKKVAHAAGEVAGSAVAGYKKASAASKDAPDATKSDSNDSKSDSPNTGSPAKPSVTKPAPSSSGSSSSSATGTKRPGLLGRVGSALKSGLKKAVHGAGKAVGKVVKTAKAGYDEGRGKSAPAATPAAKPAATKPAAKPVAKPAAAKKKPSGKGGNLDNLLKQIRSESHVPGKPAERLGAVTAISQKERDAARERTLAKAKAMREKNKKKIEEKIDVGADAGATISDFVHSKDSRFSGDSKKQRIKRALGAYYAARKEEFEIEEGMTMKDFKKNRSRQKQKEKRAADKIAPGRRAGIHDDKYSPERAARHRANVDPDFEGNDERNYPGGKLKNPKKIRKAKATGEITKESLSFSDFISERNRYEKETGTDYKTGKEVKKGGTMGGNDTNSKVMRHMHKALGAGRMGAGGAIQKRGEKKEKGAPTPGPSVTPAQKVAKRRAAADRARDMLHSRYD
jgi:hypothetical protein